MGRGTGGFLDVNNDKIGTSDDIMDRIDNIKINKYNNKTPYTTPTP
jgi:glycosylphosphatidylinositol transamidase (GPIT) subunit GPI8